MKLLALNSEFIAIGVIEEYESILWVDRYCEFGEFEIYAPVSYNALNLLNTNNYIWSDKSEHVMIIESRKIVTNPEQGSRLIVTGRSLESILERRIVWDATILTGSLQDSVETLLNENIISPTDTNRQISNFEFEESLDPIITALTVDIQLNGENLYETIQLLCDVYDIGFRITLSEDNKFIFALYSGKDRSYDQEDNSYVTFSPKFENLLSSDYQENMQSLKTTALVEGVGVKIVSELSSENPQTGVFRREIYTNATDLLPEIDGVPLSPADYEAQLDYRGKEQLYNSIFLPSFEGQVDTDVLYKYGEDFFMGDIVQLINEYEMESRVKVVELVYSESVAGVETYPTFVVVS